MTNQAVAVNPQKNDLGYDAWGRMKVINDHSIFTGMWTFSIPNRVWLQNNDTGAGYVEQSAIDNSLVKSTGGHLQVTGNLTTDVMLLSKRHPRYQPNKGLLYSPAIILPNPEYVGTRRFGLGVENAVFFELVGDGTAWKMYAVRRSTVAGVQSEQRADITGNLPYGFEPGRGHVYDTQMEWRGVGDMYIFVDLSKAFTFELLGTLTGMSISNPAMQVMFECSGAGANDILIQAGCVDVTSEGGSKSNKLYTSVPMLTLLMAQSAGTAILSVRIPEQITYDGVLTRYTRDMVLTEMTSFCKDEAVRAIYISRLLHAPNLTALTGWSTAVDSFYEYRDNTDGALDTAFQLDKAAMQLVYAARSELDVKESHQNPDPAHSDYYITPGDIIVAVMVPDGSNKLAGFTLEFAEEV